MILLWSTITLLSGYAIGRWHEAFQRNRRPKS
jgi:hypothetical protein